MFDRYGDVTEKLERQLLDRPEPPCHALAREQLKKAGIEVRRIAAVRPEAIFYISSPTGQFMTAWTKAWPSGKVEVTGTEPGMPAWQSEAA